MNNDYGNVLLFKKGQKNHLHYHIDKDKVYYVESGKIIVKTSSSHSLCQDTVLLSGDMFHVPYGICSQIQAISDSTVHEFLVGD